MNTTRKKFPRNATGADTPSRPDEDFSVADSASPRNAKIRGGIEVMHIKTDDSFNPYSREPEGRHPDGGKRDLRKLSAHIKLMRELEERKKLDDK